jgi:hypothetical protein
MAILMPSFIMLNETRTTPKMTLWSRPHMLRHYVDWSLCRRPRRRHSRFSTSCIQSHNHHRDTKIIIPPRCMPSRFLTQSKHISPIEGRTSAGDPCTRLEFKSNIISTSLSTRSRYHNLTYSTSSTSGTLIHRLTSTSNTMPKNCLLTNPTTRTSNQDTMPPMTTMLDLPNHIGNPHNRRTKRRKALRIISPPTMITPKCRNNTKPPNLPWDTHRLPTSTTCKRRGSHSMFTSARRDRRSDSLYFVSGSVRRVVIALLSLLLSIGSLSPVSCYPTHVYHYFQNVVYKFLI